jgi:hypothetical protein
MNCFVCESTAQTGGTRYGARAAVGACQACGIGLCSTHGRRIGTPRAQLLCPDHINQEQRVTARPREETVQVPAIAGSSAPHSSDDVAGAYLTRAPTSGRHHEAGGATASLPASAADFDLAETLEIQVLLAQTDDRIRAAEADLYEQADPDNVEAAVDRVLFHFALLWQRGYVTLPQGGLGTGWGTLVLPMGETIAFNPQGVPHVYHPGEPLVRWAPMAAVVVPTLGWLAGIGIAPSLQSGAAAAIGMLTSAGIVAAIWSSNWWRRRGFGWQAWYPDLQGVSARMMGDAVAALVIEGLATLRMRLLGTERMQERQANAPYRMLLRGLRSEAAVAASTAGVA